MGRATILFEDGHAGRPRIALRELSRLRELQPETFGVTIVVLIAVLAVMWWSGRQQTVGPGPLIVLAVVSGLVIHGNTLLPTAPSLLLLALVIVFPVVYELTFDSKNLMPHDLDAAAACLRPSAFGRSS